MVRGTSHLDQLRENGFIKPLLAAGILVIGIVLQQFKRISLYRYGLTAVGFGLFCGTKAIYWWHSIKSKASIAFRKRICPLLQEEGIFLPESKLKTNCPIEPQ